MEDNQNETIVETTPVADAPEQNIRELAASRFEQARAFATAKVNQIRKTATEQANHLCELATHQSEVICDKAKELHKAGEDYVKEKPTQSVLIAVGVGFLLGLLLHRSK